MDVFVNASVFSGLHRKVNIQPTPQKPPLENKIYVTFIVSDGDNLQAVQHFTRRHWDDPMRGQVPIGWTMPPAMVDVSPNILSWYWENATENDALVSGPSGIGYTYPARWPSPDALTVFAQFTAEYLERSGMNVITVWDNGGNFKDSAAGIFKAHIPLLLGVTHQNNDGISLESGLVQTGMATTYSSSAEDIEDSVRARATDFDGTAPVFIAAQADLWAFQDMETQSYYAPTELHGIMTTLQGENAGYSFVRTDHFFELIREANGLAVTPPPP
jgi:hypothetical protein